MTLAEASALRFDLREVPFSRRGSFFAVSRLPAGAHGEAGLYVRTVHGDARQKALFRIELRRDGERVEFVEQPSAAALRLVAAEAGWVEVSMTRTALHVHGTGVTLLLHPVVNSPYDLLLLLEEDRCQYTSYSANHNYIVSVTRGRLEAEPAWDGVRSGVDAQVTVLPSGRDDLDEGTYFSATIEESLGGVLSHDPAPDVEQVRAQASDDFATWPQHRMATLAPLADAATLARYVNWSSVVDPVDRLTRPTMLMSKNWMTRAWSWDHCFNAMALVVEPELAVDQFLTLFDHQDHLGALPDCIDDAGITFNFVKPPIHGWAWRWMSHRMTAPSSTVERVYAHLARWNDFWFEQRVIGTGLPHYRHGNDSGWDNGTAFRDTLPVEAPDLCAFLVVQMDVLAELAGRLGLADQRRTWETRADGLLGRMLDELWTDDGFVARVGVDRKPLTSRSLLMRVPLVLGRRLPSAVFDHMARSLVDDGFLTEYGLATESVGSDLYQRDGYWRGPIWAPSTFLIHEGLRDGGRDDLARVIASRFCDMVSRAGMAENFDALTGEGLRDRAYTWTSSVFLLLCERLSEADNQRVVT